MSFVRREPIYLFAFAQTLQLRPAASLALCSLCPRRNWSVWAKANRYIGSRRTKLIVDSADYFRVARSSDSKADAQLAGALRHGNHADITSRHRGENATQDAAGAFHRLAQDGHHSNFIIDLRRTEHALCKLNAKNRLDQL